MRISTIATVIFFLLYFVYKLFGNNDNDYWVCSFWTVFSCYLGIVSLQLSNHVFFTDSSLVWKLAAIFWGITAIVHVYLLFNIKLYKIYASATSTMTLGSILIIGFFSYLSYKIFINGKFGK